MTRNLPFQKHILRLCTMLVFMQLIWSPGNCQPKGLNATEQNKDPATTMRGLYKQIDQLNAAQDLGAEEKERRIENAQANCRSQAGNFYASLLASNDNSAASALATECFAMDPANELRFVLVEKANTAKQFRSEQLAWLEKLTPEAERSREFYNRRGFLYFHMDQYALAEADFWKLEDLGYSDYGLAMCVGECAIALNKPSLAIKSFTRAMKSDNWLAPTYRAFCYLALNRGDEAAADLGLVRGLSLEDTPNHAVTPAEFSVRRKRYEDGVRLMDLAIEKHPNVPGLYVLRGVANYRLGNLYEALDDLNASMKGAPPAKIVEARKYRALVFDALNQFRQASADRRFVQKSAGKLKLQD